MIQPATELLDAYNRVCGRQAKVTLKKKGYSYRTAAPVLGIRYESLCRILNGQFQNRRVLREIPNLPEANKEQEQ